MSRIVYFNNNIFKHIYKININHSNIYIHVVSNLKCTCIDGCAFLKLITGIFFNTTKNWLYINLLVLLYFSWKTGWVLF